MPPLDTSRDPVLHWVGYAQEAERETGVSAALLLGLTRVESGGNIHAISSAGAFGLTQFIPSTARAYGVKPGDARSQMLGAARYLKALGVDKNPAHALNAYNGAQTIGGKANPYAANVLGAAKSYTGLGKVPVPPGGDTSTTAAADQGQGGGLVDASKRGDALKALLTVTAVAGGAGLVYIGANQASGGAIHRAIKTGAMLGEEAAAA
jgi:hypothetical protein